MLVESGLEGVTSETSVAVHGAIIMSPNGGSIHNARGGALARNWAGFLSVPPAAAADLSLVITAFLVKHLGVVLVYVVL